MNEEYLNPIRELEDQMQAADALIESLESEVMNLRRDLERAGEALQAAQEEVTARGRTLEDLEESRRLRAAAEEEARVLRAELKRRTEAGAVEPEESKISALREEFRKERTTLEERHKAEIEDLKRAAEHWEEKLRRLRREVLAVA